MRTLMLLTVMVVVGCFLVSCKSKRPYGTPSHPSPYSMQSPESQHATPTLQLSREAGDEARVAG